jgi:hypothetical protein
LNAQDKHNLFSEILGDNIKNGMVNYKNLVNDNRLDTYLARLSNTDPAGIKDTNDLLAFWINIYNAFTLKLIIENYPVESINDLHKGGLVIGQVLGTTIWHHEFIKIINETYSLNNIEHDIIRKIFNEPRIHFALVCAAISCPPLRFEAYEGYKLNTQLDDQARTFLRNTKKNAFNFGKKVASLSKIIDWYDEDFGENDEEVLKYISQFLEGDKAGELFNNADDWEIDYNSYNWSLNEYTNGD